MSEQQGRIVKDEHGNNICTYHDGWKFWDPGECRWCKAGFIKKEDASPAEDEEERRQFVREASAIICVGTLRLQGEDLTAEDAAVAAVQIAHFIWEFTK